MKTITIKFITAIAAMLLVQSVNAQFGWVETSASGTKSSFRCFKNPSDNKAIYVNQKYNQEEILKEYPISAFADPSFLGYKTDLHDSFLKAIYASIEKDKIKELARKNESFELGFDLDQDGNILRIIFTLDTATLITANELYNLEENIRKLFVFKPIRKASVKLSGGFGIGTNFKEILIGKIPYIRKAEERQRETERLFGN
ncbi:MAG: hypothetical protein AB7S48_12035 [Bacteroidales bacterium]